jgi:hypothetical protein
MPNDASMRIIWAVAQATLFSDDSGHLGQPGHYSEFLCLAGHAHLLMQEILVNYAIIQRR